MVDKIEKGVVAEIAYTLTVDGEVYETVERDEAIEYLHGEEKIVPGLEAALAGKAAGESFDLTVQPEDGYGEYDDEAIEHVPADEFDGMDQLEVGMELEIMDEDGEFFEATVLEVSNSEIVLDFNPPLAGKVLEYQVEILSLREATEEELEMGIPASLMEELLEDMEDDEDYDVQNHNH